MAILNGMTGGHLDDAGLAALWTASTQVGEPTSDPHLQACAECRVRFAAFASWMEDLRLDAVAEADEAFPAERLVAQQSQILRRLEAAERPARVIAFPNAPAAEAPRPSSLRRWVAAAAAAGLIVGVGIGQMMDFRSRGQGGTFPGDRLASAPVAVEQRAAVPATAAAVSEEALLAELEAASTPRYDTLRAYDEFTPRAADYIKPR